jgi:hypothetical protein
MDVFLAVVEDVRSRHSSSEYAGVQPEWARWTTAPSAPSAARKWTRTATADPAT